MKKILIILPLIISMVMFVSCGNNTAAEKHDFRNVDFGMTAAELIAAEGEPDQQVSDDIYKYFNREVYGVPHTTLTYYIDESGLNSIRAEFTNSYDDDASYIKDYNIVKEKLIKEWGEPDSVSENESQFSFSCFWDGDPLALYKTDDGTIKFMFTAYH